MSNPSGIKGSGFSKQRHHLAEQLATAQLDIVQSQADLVEIQRDQVKESRRDRRIQYAILSVAVVALVVAISVPVALETKSVVWILVSGLGTLAGSPARRSLRFC